MSYQNPQILTLDNPVGVDRAIQSIQETFQEELAWLEKIFGRAWELKDVGPDGKTYLYPKCYVGAGEYYNVLPNDHIVAQVFFACREPEKWEEYTRGTVNTKTRQVSAIFWFNMQAIDPSKDYIFTEELKGEVERALKKNPYVTQIVAYWDERVEDVFDGYLREARLSYGRYTIADEKTQYLMYPYGGFRFDFTVSYTEEC